MNWLIILIPVVILSVLTYIFYPSIKKAVRARRENKSARIAQKQARIEEKRQMLDEKSREPEHPEDRDSTSGEDLFKDESSKTWEDPDTKVNFDNLDLGGIFNEDKPKDENIEDTEDFQKFLDKYFSENDAVKPTKKDNRKTPFSFSSDEDFDNESEEISDLLQEYTSNGSEESESEIKKQFDKLPNEIKALIISDFLDRKDI